MARNWTRVSVAIAAAVLGAFLIAPPAQAASTLVATNPSAHEELGERPGWVTLAFSRTIDKAVVKVLVVGADGRNRVAGDLIYYGSSVMVQLDNDLPKGTYTVKYQVDRKDGQPEGGAFQFAYGKGNWTAVEKSWSGTAEQPPEMANPDPQGTGPAEPSASASAEPTLTPSAVDTEAPFATASASSSSTPAPGAANNPTLWYLVGGGVAALLVVAALGWWLIRRRG